MRSGEFRKYDFGKEKNIQKYGFEEAPLYDVDKLMDFDIEKYLYIGDKDYLANLDDFQYLLEKLPKNSTSTHIIEDYAHLDYVWATDSPQLIYNQIINILETY